MICGVNNQLPGFGVVDQNGSYAGFDVDFCKAVAAAVLGDANAVEYKYASSNDRFTLVKTGEVDVLFRNSTGPPRAIAPRSAWNGCRSTFTTVKA